MPLGEIAGEILGGTLRLVGHFVIELILEILIKGPGLLLCRLFKMRVDDDGALVIIIGVLFWVLLAAVAILLINHK